MTSALRRTHDLIASELSRSEFAHETLTESSAALRQLDDSYGSLDSMLTKSRELLGTLLSSQKSDTWYLQTAFYMLATTAAWLIFRRLLYGPIWWLVLFPLRILFGVGSTATKAILPAGKSAPAQSGTVGKSGGVDDKVPVQGIPDESLPTAKVGTEQDKPIQGEVKEAVDEAVKQAVDEADTAEQVQSEETEERPASEEAPVAEEPEAPEQEEVHGKDEL